MNKVKDEFKVGKHNIGWIDSTFKSEFGSDELVPGVAFNFQKLRRSMKDSQIIKEFDIQECTLGDVVKMMDEATEEMKDGYSNLFYIKGHPSHVVRVYWGDGDWGVDGWGRGDVWWSGGIRVFSPATGPQSSSTLGSETLVLADITKIVFIKPSLFPAENLSIIQKFLGRKYLVMMADISNSLEVYEV